MASIKFSINNLIRSWAVLILLSTAFPAQAILTIDEARQVAAAEKRARNK